MLVAVILGAIAFVFFLRDRKLSKDIQDMSQERKKEPPKPNLTQDGN